MVISSSVFSELARALSKAKTTVFNDQFCTTWLILTKNNWQIVFMRFKNDEASNEFHSNNYSQWGIVLDGEMSLWIPNKRKRLLRKGDMFSISKSTLHRVAIKAGYKDITIFDGQRYKINPASGRERR